MKGRKVPPSARLFVNPQFIADRREALLSMDEAVIRAYCEKYDITMPSDPELFWRGIHKARTAATDLPMEERQKSKHWLLERGSEPMDDGEVPL